MDQDRQILNRYSKIPIDSPSPPASSPRSFRPAQSNGNSLQAGPNPNTYESKHIVRPIQFVFAPSTYLLGWLISLLFLGAYFILVAPTQNKPDSLWGTMHSSIPKPNFFLLIWSWVFISQWVIHSFVIWFKRQSFMTPRVFATSSLSSQLIFLGVVDFCITWLIFGALYVLWTH